MRLFLAVIFGAFFMSLPAADKTPFQRNQQEERTRAEAAPPKISTEETYRHFFDALQAGQYVQASEFIQTDALHALKAKTLKVLRNASRTRCTEFLQRAHLASIPDLQHAPPHAFFEAVMKDGLLVKKFLAQAKEDKIESVTSTEKDNGAELQVKYKSGREDTVSALLVQGTRSREWRLVLIPPFDE